MKKILIAVLAATVLWQVNAADSTWLTDLPKAEAQAKTDNQIVLLAHAAAWGTSSTTAPSSSTVTMHRPGTMLSPGRAI